MTLTMILTALLSLAGPTPASASLEPQCTRTPKLDISGCVAAIAAEKDPARKARLHHIRAYGLVEQEEMEAALPDLGRAISLDPDYADAYEERAFVHGELREFVRAAADIERAIALRPTDAQSLSERAYIRERSGDLLGAYEDSARVVAIEPEKAENWQARADAAVWLGRFDAAAADNAEALRIAREGGDTEKVEAIYAASADLALLRARSGGDPTAACRNAGKSGDMAAAGLIGDCTAAFLAAPTPAAKAEMLTIRALVWLVAHQRQGHATSDQEVAIGLDPDDANLRANLGGTYLHAGYSWAARRELDRAIAIKETWPALAQRAAARYNLEDHAGAFADAKRAFEIEPNETALIVLGNLSKDRDDLASAKLYWMGAWRMGSRDEAMLKRLKSIGIDHPEREPAGK